MRHCATCLYMFWRQKVKLGLRYIWKVPKYFCRNQPFFDPSKNFDWWWVEVATAWILSKVRSGWRWPTARILSKVGVGWSWSTANPWNSLNFVISQTNPKLQNFIIPKKLGIEFLDFEKIKNFLNFFCLGIWVKIRFSVQTHHFPTSCSQNPKLNI